MLRMKILAVFLICRMLGLIQSERNEGFFLYISIKRSCGNTDQDDQASRPDNILQYKNYAAVTFSACGPLGP